MRLSPAALDSAIRLLEQPTGTGHFNRAALNFGDSVETGSGT
jgi:hypothetical protein